MNNQTHLVMRLALLILVLASLIAGACSSRTHASHADKKKVKQYNSIQYGNQKKH